MNDNNRNSASGAAGEGLHEMLCAYLLGEADANQTATVEKALAESSELRAERERLEQTMGLVREAFPGGEALSESAFADVLAKAESGASGGGGEAVVESPTVESTGRPRFVLLRSNWMRAAAAVLAIGFGGWAIQQSGRSASDPVGDTAVARGEAVAAPMEAMRAGEADAEAARKNQALRESPESPESNVPARQREMAERRLDAKDRDQLAANAVAAPKEEAQALQALGYGGVVDGAEGSADVFADAPFASRTSRAQEVIAEEAPGMMRTLDAERPVPVTLADGLSSKSTVQSDAVLTGSDTFFLGRGEKPDQGTYRGPGDTVPPGGQPVTAAEPNQVVGVGGGSGGRYGGRFGKARGKKADGRSAEEKARERLGELAPIGYADGDEADVLKALGYGAGDDEDGKGWDGDFRGNPGAFFETPAQREAWIREQCRVRIRECYPRPQEMPRDMYFRFWGDNAFQLTELDSLSTFSVDVDTASYALARRYLNEGLLPTKAQVRTEEFLNYFDPDLAPPTEGTFAIYTELAPSRFGGDTPRSMLRVGVRGREVAKEERKPLSLTFVIDTSGSMKENNRLELVKHAVRLLVGELDGRDSIAIVAYSNDARVVLPLTSASQGGVIEAALYPLRPNGSTNAEAGLKLGYELAATGLDPEKNHRVVFLSDGVANVGQTDQDRIASDVKRHLDAGIYLNTIGVGMNNHNDVFLEQLADKGDGVCDYVDSPRAAQRAIVERFTGAFEPIASDVKIQVEFDPEQVHRYRLLGYENRAIADKDFRNDAVDAGEIGAGHQVVALYELELAKDVEADGPLATVRLRYKAPKGAGQDPREVDVTEIEKPVAASEAKATFADASAGYRRSVVVAQFAEFLRRSTHTYEDSFEALLAETSKLATELSDPDFDEFATLVRHAYRLGPPADYRGELDLTLDEFRRFQILRKELESLNRELDRELLEELQKRNQELEGKLRDLLHRELDKNG